MEEDLLIAAVDLPRLLKVGHKHVVEGARIF